MDDIRPCPKGFILARNATECSILLRNNEVNALSIGSRFKISDAFTMPNND